MTDCYIYHVFENECIRLHILEKECERVKELFSLAKMLKMNPNEMVTFTCYSHNDCCYFQVTSQDIVLIHPEHFINKVVLIAEDVPLPHVHFTEDFKKTCKVSFEDKEMCYSFIDKEHRKYLVLEKLTEGMKL